MPDRRAKDGAPAIPRLIAGRYRLLERLAAVPAGEVWRGFDVDLEEPVALKLLHADLAADERARAAFRREVRLARRVTHPNVARIFEFGRDGDLYYLTMEYVEGPSLRAVLAGEGPLTPAWVGPPLLAVCRGLAAAHAVGVLHGDLRPENVLLTVGRAAVLTDLGVAGVAADMHADPAGRLHVAPELLRGGPATTRSDVYAVGAMLHEALTGAPPGGPVAWQVAPTLPTLWTELIDDCLRADPRRRPADAQALLARLSRICEPRPAAPTHPTPAPLATVAGPQWLEVVPFVADDPGLELDMRWLTGDLIDALTQLRSLRVLTRGARQAGVPASRRLQIRGEVRQASDGVHVVARVQLPDGPPFECELVQPRADLHNLGVDLAARIVARVAPDSGELRRHAPLAAGIVELYIAARSATLSTRPAVALELFERALARAPGHRLLRFGALLMRVRTAFFPFRAPSDGDAEALVREVDLAVAEYHEYGEVHLARAAISLALEDSVGAALAVRAALRRAPSLVAAHVLVADLLLEIGRLADAARHLDIALALDPDSIFVWSNWSRLLAAQGRWDEFYALAAGKLRELGHRNAHLARLMLWHPDRAAQEALAAALVDNEDHLPPEVCWLALELANFGLHPEQRAAIVERIDRVTGFSQPRHRRFVTQMHCELCCSVGDLVQARRLLQILARNGLADWWWVEHCPAIAALRGTAEFAEVRARVRARADAVADALWS